MSSARHSNPDLCPGCFLEAGGDGPCQGCGYLYDPGAFPSALQPGALLSKYSVGRVLGKPGGFGITYLAFDTVLHRRVAIKELMPRELVTRQPDGATVHVHTRDDAETFKYTLESFLKEARLLAQLSHPNVVRVLDYFEANGTAYFAMEYYEGQTLAEYAKKAGGRLSGPDAAALMLPILDALEHIHSQREPILHRDIKPANIYLTGNRTPILLDFGAARATMGQQTRSLSAVLTPGFAPYEQYSSRGKQGPWSDVYGCAATLYFLVTGTMLPEASDRLDDPHVESPRVFAPDLTPHLSEAIVQGLGFKPEERPQSARLFRDLISGMQKPTQGPTERVTTPLPRPAAAKAAGHIPHTIVESSRGGLGRTEIAPQTVAGLPPPIPQSSVNPTPVTTRRPRNRMPILAGAAALVLVVAVALGSQLGEPSNDPPAESKPPVGTPPSEPPIGGGEPVGPGRGENRVSPAPKNDTIAEPPAPAAPPPVPPPATAGAKDPGVSSTKDNPPPKVEQSSPSPPAPAAPPTGVLVIVRGDDSNGVQQAETSILRALVGRNNLRALDVNSLSMLVGNRAAVDAAVSGDFGLLASTGRQHGVELMVVGELRSRAAPSINRFFTGTAELSVKMYRVSNSRLIDAQTFIVGQGGSQPVLAVSEGEAQSRAASQAADAASQALGTWLGRAF